jgi:hypothetical protein
MKSPLKFDLAKISTIWPVICSDAFLTSFL